MMPSAVSLAVKQTQLFQTMTVTMLSLSLSSVVSSFEFSSIFRFCSVVGQNKEYDYINFRK